MEYEKIVAVTGLPGLYEMVSSKTDGAIVRSLEDKSTKFVSSRIHNFSHLESIEVFTTRDNVNLVEVFEAMEKSDEKLPEEKDSGGLKKYFEKVYAELDFERVYTSDLKKMVKWFALLKASNIEIKLPEPPPAEEPAPEPVVEEKKEPKKEKKEVKEEKEKETKAATPAKKAAKPEPAPKKKAAAKKEVAEEKKEAPKKKVATKAKKEATKKEAPAKKKTATKKSTKK